MTSKRQLNEDRALRDAARALVDADVAHLKQDLSGKSLGERLVSGVGDGAKAVFQTAGDAANNNRGVLAALIGAIVIWFARNPIGELLVDQDEVRSEDDDFSEH